MISNDTAVVNGTVLTAQTFVSIRWGFIAMLAAQLILATLFLVSTIVQTHLSHTQILKGSALATLCGLDGDTRKALGGMEDVKLLSVKARQLKVTLEKRVDGAALWLRMFRDRTPWQYSPYGEATWGSGRSRTQSADPIFGPQA